ncbi:MAG TPA: nuclear transport factor 2 family protein [Labilithrix sp.]|nr:nuclear transport factor 2 family protein [Labilithrix sp.]
MRHIPFGISLALVLAACGGEEAKPAVAPVTPVATTPPPPATALPVKEEPKPQPTFAELQRKTSMGLGEALNAHDAKKIASFYTENAVVKMVGAPDVVGREAIAADWQKRFDAAPTSKAMATRVFVKGEVVVDEWSWAGTHSGDMMGMKATEKPIGAMGADVMWFTPEGLIKEQHTYLDAGTIMSQIGVSKAKGRAVPTVPSTPPSVLVSTNSPDEAKNVEAATKMFGAFEKKSDADFMGGAAEDITWDDMTQPETMKGKAAGKKYFNAMTTAFPDIKATTQNAWGVGDFVIAEGTLSGTHKAAFFGIQPTKKQINLHGLDIIQFKDGKIVSGRSYGNGAEMMMQLGLMPAPGAAGAKAAPPAGKPDAKPATPATPATPAPAKK